MAEMTCGEEVQTKWRPGLRDVTATATERSRSEMHDCQSQHIPHGLLRNDWGRERTLVRQGWALAYRRYSKDYVAAEIEA